MSDKTLGQVAYEAFWQPEYSWDSNVSYQKEFYEKLAQAVKSAVEVPLRARIQKLESELKFQADRADSNYAAYERLKSAFSRCAKSERLLLDGLDDLRAQAARYKGALETIGREMNTIADGKHEEVRNDFTSGEFHGWYMAKAHVETIIHAAYSEPEAKP